MIERFTNQSNYCSRDPDPDAEAGHQGAEQNRQHGERETSAGRRCQEDLRRQGLSEERRSSGGAHIAAALVSGMTAGACATLRHRCGA